MSINANTETVCNICGQKLDFFDRQEDYTIKKSIGYGSMYDGDIVDLHICCSCFDKIISNCVVSPLVSNRCDTQGIHR